MKKMSRFLACIVLFGMVAALTSCSKGPDKYELREEAITLYEQGDYAGAIKAFDQALDASDGQVSELQYDILKYRGECEIRIGDYTAAKTTYSALVELDKNSGDSQKAEALLSELGALDEIKKAADIFRTGNYADAYDAFSEYAVLDGTLTGRAAVYNKAVCAEYIGNFAEAYMLLSEYLEAYPDDAQAKRELEFCKTRQ